MKPNKCFLVETRQLTTQIVKLGSPVFVESFHEKQIQKNNTEKAAYYMHPPAAGATYIYIKVGSVGGQLGGLYYSCDRLYASNVDRLIAPIILNICDKIGCYSEVTL